MKCRICDICKCRLINVSGDLRIKEKSCGKWRKLDICYSCADEIKTRIKLHIGENNLML